MQNIWCRSEELNPPIAPAQVKHGDPASHCWRSPPAGASALIVHDDVTARPNLQGDFTAWKSKMITLHRCVTLCFIAPYNICHCILFFFQPWEGTIQEGSDQRDCHYDHPTCRWLESHPPGALFFSTLQLPHICWDFREWGQMWLLKETTSLTKKRKE